MHVHDALHDVSALTEALVGGPVLSGRPFPFSTAPQRKPLDPKVEAHIAAIEAERKKANEERAAALAAGSIDGRSADPRKLRARLSELGLDPHLGGVFGEPARPAPGPDQRREDPDTRRRREEWAAEARVAKLMRSGMPVTARALSPVEYAAYLRLRGITPAASYAARGVSEGT